MFKRVLCAAVILLLTAPPAFSNDGWIEKSDGKLMVYYGRGDRHDPYEPQKVKDPNAYDCDGAAIPVDIMKHKENASLAPKGDAAILTVLFDNGYWVQTTEGKDAWKNIPKREAQKKYTILQSWKMRKYAKTLLKPCAKFDKPLGLVFEIVPEKNPLSIKPGGVLPIRVLLEGKPLQGAVIKTADADNSKSGEKIKTDKDGKASVVISKRGQQAINIYHRLALKDDPDADKLGLSASLTFEVK